MDRENLRLNQVRIGRTVRVVRVHGEGALRQRILDMGLTKNAEVKVLKMAPFGDPIEMTVRKPAAIAFIFGRHGGNTLKNKLLGSPKDFCI